MRVDLEEDVQKEASDATMVLAIIEKFVAERWYGTNHCNKSIVETPLFQCRVSNVIALMAKKNIGM